MWYKELIKKIASLPLEKYDGISSEDKFFQLNALTGDLLTNINKKDGKSDIDAMIMYYHPKFKDLPLNARIIEYYSTENLDVEREKFKSEVLPIIVKKDVNNKLGYLFVASATTLGGLVLTKDLLLKILKNLPKVIAQKGRTIIKKTKSNLKITKKFIENKMARKLKKVKSNIKNYIAKKIVKPIRRKVVSIKRKAKRNVKKLAKRMISPVKRAIKRKINNSRTIKYLERKTRPIRRIFNKKIYRPARKFVTKRIYRPIKTIVNRARRYSRKIKNSISKSKKFISNGFRKLKRLFRR
ncbi:hypothetical protein ABKP99_03865 [Mammaliicoccus sciuri]